MAKQASKNTKPQPRKAQQSRMPVRSARRGPATVSARTNQAVMGRGPTTGKQQELVIEVVKGSNSFTLHPSQIAWLAQVAPSHQEWTLANLRIWYEPRVGTNTQGTVSLGTVADFQDLVPSSLASITRLTGSKRGAPWTPFVINAPPTKWCEYISSAGFEALNGTDKNSRALGRIFVFADMDSTFPADEIVGRVYIEYDAMRSLRKPTDPTLQQ